MAKGITSGYVPLGGVGCTEEVIKPIDIFQHLHTYANHPVSCAAALKNIEIMKTENLVLKSKLMGDYFLKGLKTLAGHPTVGEVRGTGLWTAVDFTMDKKTRAPFSTDRLTSLVNRAKEKGLIIKLMGPALEFAPPLIIQKEEIDWALKILNQVITEEEKAMGL
jgi:putrescine aminotransferase